MSNAHEMALFYCALLERTFLFENAKIAQLQRKE